VKRHFLIALLASSACRSQPERGSSYEPGATSKVVAQPSAQSAPFLPPVFRENDYPSALRDARERNLPLFVDAWAPWCHSCVSMKAFVFKDPALSPVVSKFVWVAVDTEHQSSKEFLSKFPMEVWPTLWVIDPKTDEPILEWAGAATAADLVSLLEATLEAAESREPKVKAAWAAWQAGNRHIARGRRADGIAAYQEALNDPALDFAARPRVVEALVFHLRHAGNHTQCLETAAREFEALPKGTSRLNTVLSGLGCARTLMEDRSKSELSSALRLASKQLLAEATRIVQDPTEPVLADDRSSLFQELLSQHETAGEKATAKTIAAQWSAFLDAAAAQTESPEDRVVFDYHRMLAYAALGAKERSIGMLEQSERDIPDDYNPSSRLAKVQFDLGRFEASLASVDRSLAKVYGPRTLRVMKLKADILEAMQQPEDAREVLNQAVEFGERSGPLGEGYQRLLEELKVRAREPAMK
jgi:tetratricopeptide (TPR) repeat protein